MASTNLTAEELAVLANESKQATAYAIIILFTLLALIIVSLRMYTRLFLIKKPGPEDYIIGISMINSLIMGAFMIREVKFGLGRHIMFLSLEDIEGLLSSLFGSIITYNFSLTLTKMSILLQYRRIFFASDHSNKVIYIAIVITGIYGVCCFFTSLLSCLPVRAFWDLKLQATAKCLPKFPMWFTNAGLNIATDLMIACIPIPVLMQLTISTRRKVALIIMFCIGWAVCIVSFLRIHALIEMKRHFEDFSWHTQEATYWSCIETNTAIICACLPALNPLLMRLGISISGSSQQEGENYNHMRPGWLRKRRTAEAGAQIQAGDSDHQNQQSDQLRTIGHVNRKGRRRGQWSDWTTQRDDYGPMSVAELEVVTIHGKDSAAAEFNLKGIESKDESLATRGSSI